MDRARDLAWWKRAAGLGSLWRRVRRLLPFCTLILRFHVEAAQAMPETKRAALERQLAANLERMLSDRPLRLCDRCQRPFRPRQEIQRFCSRTCKERTKDLRAKARQRGYAIERGEQRCVGCGAAFVRACARGKVQLYCTPRCEHKAGMRRYRARRRAGAA